MMANEFVDYFEILDVKPDDSPAAVGEAYRRKAKELHPDVGGNGEHESFVLLQNAYDTLSSPEQRRLYFREHARHYGAKSLIDFKPAVRDLFDDLVEYVKGVTGFRKKDGFELMLDNKYSANNKIVKLNVPLVTECLSCRGVGSTPLFTCGQCGGKGSFTTHRELEIEIPGDTPDGSIITRDLPGQLVVVKVTYR
jgi:DnaJ-class molecular chaperone